MTNGTTFYGKLCEKNEKAMDDLKYDVSNSVNIDSTTGWVESIIEDAFEELSEVSIDDVNIEADVYTHQLMKWFSDNFAIEICEEAREELGCEGKSIIDQIILGQWYAKDRIYHMVSDWLEQNGDKNDE